MKPNEIEDIELDIFLNAVNKCYGYDFHDYARSSIKRRVKHLLNLSNLNFISELLPKIFYDEQFLNIFLKEMSISVTNMFRDPWVFKTIKNQIIPKLKVFPRINIWHAGCATGEEVYSLAILLMEQGLLKYSQIYATDFNNNSLEIAKEGKYLIDNLDKYIKNYQEVGGENSFYDYFYIKDGYIIFNDLLKKNIVFTNHNLVEDNVFGEMNLVVCRNVLIYFKKNLQNKVLKLFEKSLSSRGFLILGDKESLKFSTVEENFEESFGKEKIYRKK